MTSTKKSEKPGQQKGYQLALLFILAIYTVLIGSIYIRFGMSCITIWIHRISFYFISVQIQFPSENTNHRRCRTIQHLHRRCSTLLWHRNSKYHHTHKIIQFVLLQYIRGTRIQWTSLEMVIEILMNTLNK